MRPRIAMQPRGFTLIELLVAMAVLAIIASVSFRGLNSILEAESHVRAETRRWNDVSLALAHMYRDLSLAVARPVRDDQGRVRAAVIVGNPKDETQERLAITRLGDLASSQSDLRRVAYRLRERTLEYLIWPALDAAPGSAPAVNTMLEDVADLQLRALGKDGSWSSLWPAVAQANALPRAVEARIVLSSGESVSRVFLLR